MNIDDIRRIEKIAKRAGYTVDVARPSTVTLVNDDGDSITCATDSESVAWALGL